MKRKEPFELTKMFLLPSARKLLAIFNDKKYFAKKYYIEWTFLIRRVFEQLFMKYLIRNDDINVQELEDELTYHYKDEDFESIETDFEDPINV